jgi:hypothetical protein
VAPCSRGNASSARDRVRKRLLTEHILAALEGRHREGFMAGRRRRNRNEVDVRIRDQLGAARVWARYAELTTEFLQPIRRDVRGGRQRRIATDHLNRSRVLGGHDASSDDTDSDQEFGPYSSGVLQAMRRKSGLRRRRSRRKP